MKKKYYIVQAILILAMISGNAMAEGGKQSPLLDLTEIRVLDLKTAGRIALSQNPSVASAGARVLQAKERVLQVRALYWPKVTADVTASKVWLSDTNYSANFLLARALDPNASIKDPQEYYGAAINLGWNLFDGFEKKYLNESAKIGQSMTEMSEGDLKRVLLSLVADAYFVAQLAHENIGIAKANESFYGRQLEEARIRREVGTGSLSDELNFEIRTNGARVESVDATRSYRMAMLGLAALLGVEDEQSFVLKELAPLVFAPPMELSEIDGEKLVDYALEHRPDVMQSGLAVKKAGSDINVAKAKYYPSLDFGASLDGARTGDMGFDGDDFGHSVGLFVSYDIFSGGLRKARVSEAKARQSELSHDYDQVRIDVGTKIYSSLNRLTLTRKEYEIVTATLSLVKRQRDLVELEYNAGQSSLVRLNEAQRDLSTAQGRLSLALASLNQIWYQLEAETGRIQTIFEH